MDISPPAPPSAADSALLETFARLPAPLLVAGPDLTVLHLNAPFCRIHRLRAPDVLGGPLRAALPELDGSQLGRVLSERQAAPGVSTLEPSASTLFLDTTVHSGPWGLAIMHGDASAKRQVEQLQWEFLDGLAHGFQTPLTAISGYAETLLSSKLADPVMSLEFIERIRIQSQLLSQAVNDVLFISRLDFFRKLEDRQPVDLRRLVSEVSLQCSTIAAQRNIELDSTVGETPLLTSGSYPMLSMMLFNLVDNALKYSHGGGHVHIAALARGAELSLAVTDDGIGIRPSEKDRLFARFFRGDQARSGHAGGSGLGLAKVLSIVKAHGGRIDVQGEPGQGSTFEVTLPALAP